MTVYYKMRQMLLQNATAILLQNATEVYYKMRQLSQNATILLQNATVITKCDIYYKLLRTLEAIEYVKKYPTFQEKYKLHG